MSLTSSGVRDKTHLGISTPVLVCNGLGWTDSEFIGETGGGSRVEAITVLDESTDVISFSSAFRLLIDSTCVVT